MQRESLMGGAIRRAGFTLIEVMIAMLIGVIGIVVMMQTFSVSEGFKRTATSGTDAQINGAVALYMLEREIRLAGFGMNSLLPAGCMTVRVWNQTYGTTGNMRVVPFEINPVGIPAGDLNTDVILVAYGNADSFVAGVPTDQSPQTAVGKFVPQNNLHGFRNGDFVIGMQPGAGPGGTPSCVMHELTWVPNGSGNCGVGPTEGTNVLLHATSQYKHPNQGCQLVTPQRNNGAGITETNGTVVAPLNRANGGMLYNVGSAPQVKVYAVRSGNLTVCDWITTDCGNTANYQVVVNDIVSLRAIYGADFDGNPTPGTPAGDGVIDRWTRAPITTNFQASRVLGVSLGIAARSGVKEKPTTGTTCDATTDQTRPDRAQAWFGPATTPADGTVAASAMNISTSSPDWRCYRYKLFQTSVPLRNMIWKP